MRLTTLMVLLLLQPAALAQEELFEFKGVKLGASETDLIAAMPALRCAAARDRRLADRSCNAYTFRKEDQAIATFGGHPAELSFMFYDDRLSLAAARTKEGAFNDVVAALIQRYGAPHVVEKEEIQTRAGVKLENVTMIWKRGGSSITAKRYAGKIDTSSFYYVLDAQAAEFKRRRDQDIEKKASDL